DECDWGKIKWPSEEKYEPDHLLSSDISSIFEDVFTKGANLEVYDTNGKMVDIDDVIKEFVKLIDQRNNLPRTKKTMEAMAIRIKKELENRYVKISFFTKGLREDHLKKYLKNELNNVFKSNVDPTLQLMNRLK
ncbi:MAG: hypothetical protein GX639_18250, partial [Fibrobacter sp.]|nr:hypothetical protein [Fibrobacter sp.]